MSIRVEVFSSPDCGKCGNAKLVIKAIVDEFDSSKIQWREVNIIDEIDYAVELGVLSTPSIAINGKVVFTSLPSAKNLRQEIEKALR